VNDIAKQAFGIGEIGSALPDNTVTAADRALIAIDNKQLGNTIRHYLQTFGVKKIDMARTCAEARAFIDNRAYSLAYIDFNLPSMGGPDFVRFMRTSGNDSEEALVTMMMTSPRKDDVFQARDAGSNEIISLPISTKHLMLRLDHMLKNPRPIIKAAQYVGPCRRRRELEVAAAADRRQA
jgi:two-component system chemotaxis response regulator CheY